MTGPFGQPPFDPNNPQNQPGWQPPQQPFGKPQYGQSPYGPPSGPKKSGRGKIVAICAAAAVVLGGGVFAVVHFTGGGSNPSAQRGTESHPTGHPVGSSTSGGDSTAPNKKCTALTDIYNPSIGTFQQVMTNAIESHNRAAFLALASTDAARAKMGLWWDNASAVGFAGGESYVDNDANDPGHSALTSVILDVALHSPLDVVSPGKYGAGILAPMTQYKAGIASVGAKCALSVTSWTSLADTPLDVPEHLYVVHTTHTVVAGEPQMKSEINRIAPIAEKAAVWDFGFFKETVGGHSNYVQQKGFVVYIPTTNVQAEKWFRAPTAPKAKGWTADAGNVAGTSYPLPGPNSFGKPKLTGPKLGQGSAVAGARVLLTATGRKESSLNLEATLVHEYVHDILTTDDISAYLGGKPLAAATAEGAARWIESYFRNSPASYKVGKKYARAQPNLRPTIKANIGRFNGKVPSDAQVYGSSSLANFYYDLSASTFDYLAYKYGSPFALQSVINAYTNGGGPFGGVISNIKGSTITFANPSSYVGPWAKWVRAGLPDR